MKKKKFKKLTKKEKEEIDYFLTRLRTLGTFYTKIYWWRHILTDFFKFEWKDEWGDCLTSPPNANIKLFPYFLEGSKEEVSLSDEIISDFVREKTLTREEETAIGGWLLYGRKSDAKRLYGLFREWIKEAKKKHEEFEKLRKESEEFWKKEPIIKTNNSGFVYLIKSGIYYKIGISRDPKQRIKNLQTSTPLKVKKIIVKEVENYLRIEEDLHEKFKEKRVRREWFNLNKEDVSTIKSILTSQEIKV